MTRDRAVTAAVFDLGGVLIDWNPRHLYRRLFGFQVHHFQGARALERDLRARGLL